MALDSRMFTLKDMFGELTATNSKQFKITMFFNILFNPAKPFVQVCFIKKCGTFSSFSNNLKLNKGETHATELKIRKENPGCS